MTHVQLGAICPVCGLMHMAPQGACEQPVAAKPVVEEPKVEKVEKKPKAKKAAKKEK